jgi:hypothetical protein
MSSRDSDTDIVAEPERARCAMCGTVATGPELPLGWSTAIERGQRHDVCSACARENVRSIEGRLAPEWW